ncbi:mechanosensitive ion channel domain-containing protein [uncultured Psychroserpens sp.]|uniref:mechanosensitive ion channel domain-containing protein n=1 Tax=uncultured Psychroserpens sp. TaxID=255436 RepID=UPI002612E344|nr:mechanosensitive ion channel domain-containing protein [uncultured Psychroserpens sp.]
MKLIYIKIIETLVIIITYLIIKRFIFKVINKTLSNKLIQESRGVLIRNVINLVLAVISMIFISLIWGVNQSDLAVFIGSVLTVVGVAFFAQWSLLSNITSSIIIFFNHPVKLKDSIIILEGKDYGIEGVVSNIGLFFVTLETKESGEITLPNNIFILKSIKNITNEKRIESNDKETS